MQEFYKIKMEAEVINFIRHEKPTRLQIMNEVNLEGRIIEIFNKLTFNLSTCSMSKWLLLT